jgi:hypothetical protein
VWISDDVRGWGMPGLVAMLAALERVQAEAAERAHEMFADEEAMVQWYAATTGTASDAFDYDLGGSVTARSRLTVVPAAVTMEAWTRRR